LKTYTRLSTKSSPYAINYVHTENGFALNLV
jgi:hypothetical protein